MDGCREHRSEKFLLVFLSSSAAAVILIALLFQEVTPTTDLPVTLIVLGASQFTTSHTKCVVLVLTPPHLVSLISPRGATAAEPIISSAHMSSSAAERQLLNGDHQEDPHSKRHTVERGHKTESYLVAIQNNPVPLTLNPLKSEPLLEKLQESPQKRPDTVGLSLEELEKYKDDPFWSRLRWFLFVLFWLLWIVMFVAAIVIVFISPACSAKFVPTWFQTAVVYQAWVPSIQDSNADGLGDFNGLSNHVEDLRRLGVSAIFPRPFLLSDDLSETSVRDYMSVDSKLGTNAQGDTLIKKAHDKGLKVVITVPVAATSDEHDWFLRSARASLPENSQYANYYYWKRTGVNSEFVNQYRNSKVFYWHVQNKPNMPLLNWRNAQVKQAMFEVFTHWIKKGIDGFHLDTVEYLARVPDGSKPDWDGISDLIKEICAHVDEVAGNATDTKVKNVAIELRKRSRRASG
uniref:Aamy domain-containing protein n=1 Tax=Steinernema glaseri TaxID=37863 RepID=A0A1I7ZSU7_9BILA